MHSDESLPADTTVVKQVGPWSIHVSRSTFALYVETGDYHALPLQLSVSDLQELLKTMEAVRERIKQDVVSSLQASLLRMIADDPGRKILEGCRIALLPPED